ncbi:hypothetical protein GCM10011507_24230 [Edaphobacter acidisoli]|uniref:C2H2-type domain-containing protein n=1 Tax=Edaphobacter acidisoli TaxID=2040573 RepID=A0A916W789_9BACT|nr:hypothetical protein [Edaphobacter acidisoli]GGA71775.1 hypothetical protein GCM10011507_24230 [Edaphobacter acidisoli]
MHLVAHQPKLSGEIRCPICGQGFLIFEELAAHASLFESRRIIQQTLRSQHTSQGRLANAHPENTFDIPSWQGEPPFSASASLSDLIDNSI